MNKKLLVSGVMATAFVVASCVSTSSRNVAGFSLSSSSKKSSIFADFGTKGGFSDSDVEALSSAPNLPLAEARVITDNDESFTSKLEMIKRARTSIDMVYFIYAEDDSSGAISSALVQKAASGVKVQLLVDFITNFTKFDHFQMMEKEGRGNLKVYYYLKYH